MINKHKAAKHFAVTITDDSLAVARNQAQIDAEAAIDGIYVIRTPVPAETLDAAGAVAAYKDLKTWNATSGTSRPRTWTCGPSTTGSKTASAAHVLICMLACYLTWHLRQAWAPLTFTDEHPPARGQPRRPRPPLGSAEAKAVRSRPGKQPIRSFRDLIDHLATLTRNQSASTARATVAVLAEPTPAQRRAFDLIGAPIPLTLT